MKTLVQCLEGVSAGGKFEADIQAHDEFIIVPVGKLSDGRVKPIAHLAGITSEEANFRYIARACSTWPILVKALKDYVNECSKAHDQGLTICPFCRASHEALAEALKD